MWQRFTERARRVVFFAQEEAGRLGENYISTEHLLLGLARENDSIAARILDRMGISLERIRSEVERQVTRGDGRLGQDMQLTPRAKRVIDLAYDEARQLSNNYIGSEHLLLGLIREGEGLAGRVLAKLGVELNAVRQEVWLVQDPATRPDALPTSSPVPSTVADPTYQARSMLPISAPATREMREILEANAIIVQDETGWRGKSFLSLQDVTTQQITTILDLARHLKAIDLKRATLADARFFRLRWVYPRTIALLFEKPSLRTRVSFEAGMAHLGGHAIHLAPGDVGLGAREAVEDVAAVLSHWVDCIAARVFKHETVEELAATGTIPVINALSDLEHPCQALADLLTIQEQKGGFGAHLKLAYVGDGNNVLHSLLLACAKLGIHIAAACPPGYEPLPEYVEAAQTIAELGGTAVDITHDPIEAVREADVVYTDVWTSMGQEEEKEARLKIFAPYQVNAELLSHAKSGAIVLHCLPAHRGEEITADVMEQHKAVILEQAENRMHTQKALVALILGP